VIPAYEDVDIANMIGLENDGGCRWMRIKPLPERILALGRSKGIENQYLAA
jgi:hypothetical protein